MPAVGDHLSHHDVVNEKGSGTVGSNPAGNVVHVDEAIEVDKDSA